jgi:hypothetical protein
VARPRPPLPRAALRSFIWGVGGAAVCILVTALVLGSHWWQRSPLVVLAVLLPSAAVVGVARGLLIRRRARASRNVPD